MEQFEEFFKQYIETALWASTDENDDPLDRTYDSDDFLKETLSKMRETCLKFYKENLSAMFKANRDFSQHGHDFFLTHNGHGAGFWDRGYPNNLGNILSDACKKYPEINIYVTDDGHLEIM